MINIGRFKTIYVGSVKNLRIKIRPTKSRPGVYLFEYTDDFSIFDYGKMPDAIPGKGATAKRAKKRPEFAALTRYIFPGGELDYLWRTIADLEGHGFEVRDVEGWREHYQRTCRMWHDRLLARYDEACGEVGEATTRVWLAYLAACSLVFERNACGVYQTLVCKRARGASGLPPTRADLYC